MSTRAIGRGVFALLALAGLVGGCTPQQHSATSNVPVRDAHVADASRTETQGAADVLVPIPKGSTAATAVETPTTPAATLQLRDFLPHIRLDATAKVVEIDGVVPIDAHNERAPNVYLEVLVCGSDTREHEAVVVTEARPSQVHAALLAIGLEPGKPGSYSWQGEQVQANPATGPRVRVEVIVGDASPMLITDWAINVRNGQTLTSALRDAGHAMLFAGSVSIERDRETSYLGDGAGTLVGLSTFGTETIACQTMFNPDSAVEEPVWIANAAMVPVAGTPARVRISAE